jgi:hypothetical protein
MVDLKHMKNNSETFLNKPVKNVNSKKITKQKFKFIFQRRRYPTMDFHFAVSSKDNKLKTFITSKPEAPPNNNKLVF